MMNNLLGDIIIHKYNTIFFFFLDSNVHLEIYCFLSMQINKIYIESL